MVMLNAIITHGCKEYLEVKPDKSLAIPTTLKDLQALLDNYATINNRDPLSGEVSSDDYYLTDSRWESLTLEGEKRMYLWEKDYFFQSQPNEWGLSYTNIYFANTVLEQIEKIDRNNGNQIEWDNIKGQALFIRGKSYLQMVFIFCLAYDDASRNTDLGLPIRTSTNFNEKSVRSSLGETYDFILRDLELASELLQIKPTHVMRSSKPAAYGLMARTNLSMGKYIEAGKFAGLCLKLKNDLIDYRLLSSSKAFPFTQFNEEVIYESMSPPLRPLRNNFAKIDDNLYRSYTADDMRQTLFFKNNGDDTFNFKGSYEGGPALFTGLATDEMYLTRAECYARSGDLENASKDMETLLKLRIVNYQKPVFNDIETAVKYILQERRKQLLMRGLRWMDIKRLNKEGFGITLNRTIKGVNYSLSPNSPRYALPIPEDVVALSGMQQNIR